MQKKPAESPKELPYEESLRPQFPLPILFLFQCLPASIVFTFAVSNDF